MQRLETLLANRGTAMAVALEDRGATICETTTTRFAALFETLLLDLTRPDVTSFQRLAFEETPRRLHRLLQVALRFQTIAVIEREYRWSWGILPRYGITLRHMQSMVRSYFEAARAILVLDQLDRHFLDVFERAVLDAVERSAPLEALRVYQPNKLNGNGYNGNGHHGNGRSHH
jgi:hypothetical protein